MLIDGGCFCRAIQYRAEVDPGAVSVCHCTDCQQLTGSPYRVTVIISGKAAPQLISGEPRTFAKAGESGNVSVQHFCGDCGSPLFFSNRQDGSWGIRWGSITQRAALTPKRQMWCSSAVPWIGDINGLPGQLKE